MWHLCQVQDMRIVCLGRRADLFSVRKWYFLVSYLSKYHSLNLVWTFTHCNSHLWSLLRWMIMFFLRDLRLQLACSFQKLLTGIFVSDIRIKSQHIEISVLLKWTFSVDVFGKTSIRVREQAFPVKLGVKLPEGRAEAFSLPACDVRYAFVCACVYVTAGCVKACIAGCWENSAALLLFTMFGLSTNDCVSSFVMEF